MCAQLIWLRWCFHHVPWSRPKVMWNCDSLLNLSLDHFGLQQGKIVIMTMEFKVPKTYILRPTLSTNIVQCVLQWERQKKCSRTKRQVPMAKKWYYSSFLKNFLKESKIKARENKRTVELDFSRQDCPFWTSINQHIHFGASSFLLVQIRFTPSEGPKAL